MGRDTVRVAICQPSYKGPHKDCFDQHQEFFHYLGRLQERSYWLDCETHHDQASRLPSLDRMKDDGASELRPEDPLFEFYMTTWVGHSIIAAARDDLVSRALKAECDYVFFFDDDMIFARDAFLRLWRHQVSYIGALAFTSRRPIAPVLFRFTRAWDHKRRGEVVGVEPIFDYPEDALYQVDAIGAGVNLISTDIFRKLKAPWFNGSVGMGEDVYLGWKCKQAGIPVYCDTSVKTLHAPNEPYEWHDERSYLKQKEFARKFYEAQLASDNSNPDLQQLPADRTVPVESADLHGIPV